VDLAQKSGVKKEDVSTGVLTLTPSYERDKNKAKSYAVKGILTITIRYASVDIRQLEGLATLASGVNGRAFEARTPAALPSVAPEKITVSATVKCAFQIQ
jgi:hypothetical protein